MAKRQFLVTVFGSNIDVFVAPRQILKFFEFWSEKTLNINHAPVT